MVESLDSLPKGELQRIYKALLNIKGKPRPYKAHKFQEILHRSTSKLIIASAGNRGGKSEAGLQELIWRVMGTHPYKKVKVPIKAWVGSFDMTNGIAGIILPKLFTALDKRYIDSMHRTRGIVDQITLINGSTIEFRSYEQDSDKWEGKDLDYLWLDEPPPESHYIAARRGLVDRGGDVLLTATLVNEEWVSEKLYEPASKGELKDVELITWTSYDNPYIDHDEVRRFERDLSPEEAKVRIYGQVRNLSGRVLKRFADAAPFVIPDFEWPRDWRYFEVLDPHMSRAHAFSRWGINPRGDFVCFYTASIEGDMSDLARHIISTRPPTTEPVIPTICDSSINVYDNMIKMNLRDRLALEGVPTTMAQKANNIMPGYDELNNRLYKTEQNRPGGIYVMERCRHMIREWKFLRWDMDKDDKTKGDDDFTDGARYLFVMEPEELMKVEVYLPVRPVSYTDTPKTRMSDKVYTTRAFDVDVDEEDKDEDDGDMVFSFEIRG